MLRMKLVPSLFVSAMLVGLSVACAPEETDAEGSEDDVVATFNQRSGIDLGRTTRILLVGDSSKLGDLPLYAATARARRYAKLYPNEQIVLFITKDVKDANVARTGASVVRAEAFGEGIAMADLSRLSSTTLIKAMDRFSKIASIDFFGHSSPFGALLEAEGDNRVLNATIPGNAATLKDNFARDVAPYVTLNGCNGGVETAAKLSNLWAIPVSGALTGSNFEELKSDNHFYINDDGFFPPNLTPAQTNSVSYGSESPRCAGTGACIRMKPQDAPYYGVWSNQDTGMQYGLGFYKFFCDYQDNDKSCVKGMAASLHAFVAEKALDRTSSDTDVKAVLAEFFCTRAKDPNWFASCKANLEAAVQGGTAFSPMRTRNDYTLECDFKKCTQEFRCTRVNGVPQKKTCAWVAPGCVEGAAPNSARCFVKNTVKQTTNREYAAYLEGQRLLREGGAPAPVTCFSSTVQRDLPAQSCVQSRRDNKWYRCENAAWVSSDGVSGCGQKFPL
jgi:hypothetical protein